MKKFISLIAASIILAGCQTTESAQVRIEMIEGPAIQKVHPWYKGEIVGAQTLCKDEESIMRLVLADTKSEEAVKVAMYTQSMMGNCVMLPKPTGVPIMDILTEYKDFAGRRSVVLIVAFPTSGGLAYIIAGGRRGPPKEKGRPA